ncbi:MAG: glycosyltransferase family 61 protein [Actinobacteria bacterium]|nr:glycosyltransferase family 61 protein [Actinomycetota bacterium]
MNRHGYLNRIPTLFKVFNDSAKKPASIIKETEQFAISEWSNVEVSNIYSNKDTREIYLSGRYFIIQPHLQYYHFMLDYIAVFCYLKSLYPEIKPIVLIKTDDPEYAKNFPYKDILDELEIGNIYAIDDIQNSGVNYNKFILESVVYLYSKPFDVFKMDDILLNFRNLVYKKRPIDKNKKIYISRRDSNRRAGINNEELLEKYFKDLGFKTVLLTGMSILEQRDLFSDAAVVVGRSGSSFTNMFFMSDETKIIDINIEFDYAAYEYKKISEILKLDYCNISMILLQLLYE